MNDKYTFYGENTQKNNTVDKREQTEQRERYTIINVRSISKCHL